MKTIEDDTYTILKCLAFAIICVLLYLIYITFHSGKTDLTIDPANSLIQIIGIIISSLNLIIFFNLTLKINQYTIDKDRPVLIFELAKGEIIITNGI